MRTGSSIGRDPGCVSSMGPSIHFEGGQVIIKIETEQERILSDDCCGDFSEDVIISFLRDLARTLLFESVRREAKSKCLFVRIDEFVIEVVVEP